MSRFPELVKAAGRKIHLAYAVCTPEPLIGREGGCEYRSSDGSRTSRHNRMDDPNAESFN